ncbi:MAG: HEAT repeat domain-containing protein [Symploca sp. SIO3C6]|nr:HEAT repeat domain-containing protein [Symploca sp. SIO3C6]
MELDDIRAALTDSDYQHRLKAIAALREYEPDVAIPLLTSRLNDPEFLVRSFVAMGLGHQQGPESFAALLQMIKLERDTNVKAEAANSLSLYGKVSITHLVTAFFQNDNWLVRRSIIAAVAEMDCPEELYEIALEALMDHDLTVQQSGIDALGLLSNTSHQDDALEQLLGYVKADTDQIRTRVAYALKRFDDPRALESLACLRQDPNHTVVGATLEDASG